MEPADVSSAPEDEAELWRKVREHGDSLARERLVDRYLPYARIMAATYYARRTHDEIEFDDYLQFARVGMLEALDRYDPAAGALFKTFAARRMHGAILDGLDQCTEKQRQIAVRRRLQRERIESLKSSSTAAVAGSRRSHGDALFEQLAEVGIGLALGLLLEDTAMFVDESQIRSVPDNHYQHVELGQLRRRLHEYVGQLPDTQRCVIRGHYLQNRAFEEIAAELGLSKGRVSQVHKEGLMSLRHLLGAHRRFDIAF